MRAIFRAAVSGVALLSLATPAAANGRFPASNQIVFSPTDANLVVLRTSYGLLPSHDHGASWTYLCEDALGLGPTALEDPSIGLTTHNALIAGVGVGLDVSKDVGCNWNCIGGLLAGQAFADIAIRPDDTTRAVALTRTYLPTDAALNNISSQVFETTDEGATWSPIGTPIDSTVTVTTLDVAKTDPNRIYVSGTRHFGSAKTASLFVSNDKGATWTEQVLPPTQFDPSTEDAIFIGAIDPTNADRVYLRSNGVLSGGKSRLTVVTNASTASPQFKDAYHFDVAMQQGLTGELLGFALSEDGSKIYVGSEKGGLWVGSAADLMFHKTSSIIVQCLAVHGHELWACSAPVSGFVAGVSTDDGVTFTPKLPLIGSLAGPIACAANPQGAACGTTTNSSQCVAAYATFCSTETCAPADAGARAPATAPAKASSSSCDVAVVGGGGAAACGAAVAMTGLALRRRRREPSTRKNTG